MPVGVSPSHHNTLTHAPAQPQSDASMLQQLEEGMANLTLLDAHHLLYCCEEEERDLSHGQRGVYAIPGDGHLPFAGIAG